MGWKLKSVRSLAAAFWNSWKPESDLLLISPERSESQQSRTEKMMEWIIFSIWDCGSIGLILEMQLERAGLDRFVDVWLEAEV